MCGYEILATMTLFQIKKKKKKASIYIQLYWSFKKYLEIQIYIPIELSI